MAKSSDFEEQKKGKQEGSRKEFRPKYGYIAEQGRLVPFI
jgi:hypothetical protein